jgi:glycine C-acetyltransferase
VSDAFLNHIRATLDEIEAAGLFKRERLLTGPQGGHIRIASAGGQRGMLNLCANNYLGLADHPEVIAAAKRAMDEFGFGMASVRFICGAQTLHRELEQAIAKHLGKDDAIVFAACFDANGGVFEPLMGEEDAILSDSLNHASIIDGVRLSKARRYRFASSDMNELEDRLKEADADGARFKLVATDGVFSMDGYVAKLQEICALADRYGALVLVDDAHAIGHLGEKGRGTPSLTGAGDRVDIVTGTFGKTLGGGMGGFAAAAQPLVDLLRQRARPYLFSNSLAPPVAAGALKALEIAIAADDRRALLQEHTRRFRAGIEDAGFRTLPGVTPIIPVMLGEARLAQDLAKALDERGVYVAGFFFPVVPKGAARIRTQMSAALAAEDVDFAVAAFADAGKALGIV